MASCQGPQPVVQQTTQEDENTVGYDSLLAKKLGADQYGMKSYVMAFLKKGPNRDRDSISAAALQRAHLDNINKMAEEGKLVLAGPFMDEGEIRGIYVFDVPTIEEAEELTNSDPAVQAGSLVMELHQWYGSAGLGLLNELYPKFTEEEI
jgi:uncharacterized protein YciI